VAGGLRPGRPQGAAGPRRVLNYEGHGAQARIQVNFDDEGSKWLMVAYAKLQAL